MNAESLYNSEEGLFMDVNNRSVSFNHHSFLMNEVQTFNRESKRTEIVLKEQEIELNPQDQKNKIGNGPPVELIYGPAEKDPLGEFNSILNKIDTLTVEEKHAIRDAVEQSVSFRVGGVIDAGPLGIMHMNFELTYLNEQYIPKEFQEQMQAEIERLTDEKLKNFTDPLAKLFAALEETKQKIDKDTARYESVMREVEELEQGTHYLQSLHHTYRGWFDELAASDSFVEGYEKLLQNFEDLLVSQSNGATQNAKGNADYVKNQLRNQWNAFSNALPDKQAPKAPTKDEPLINITV